MKYCYFVFQKITLFWNLQKYFSNRWMLAILMLSFFSISGYSQTQTQAQTQNSKSQKMDIVVQVCTQHIGNGLYRANFGYKNPNNMRITIDEDNSYLVYNKGEVRSNAINNFNKGSENKAFTMEFGAKQSIRWTVISPSGKAHTATANTSCSPCAKEEEVFIFPVVGQGNGKKEDLIGMNLGSLNTGSAGNRPSKFIFQISEDKQKVMIVIVPKEGKLQEAVNILRNKYAIPLSDFLIDPVKIVSENLSAIDVNFPIRALERLNSETAVMNFVRPLYPSIRNSEINGNDVSPRDSIQRSRGRGIVVSQGDSVQRSEIIRDSYRIKRNGQVVPVDGQGVNVGVISNSFDTQPFSSGVSKAKIDEEQGDLPDNPKVQVFKEYSLGTASDEGRAMLQIVHDIAPGSELGFYAGTLSPRDFELGVKMFSDAGYNIVLDDITFITEPFFGGGRIAQAIRSFTSKPGRSYFSSAGNVGNQAGQSIFKSSSSAPETNFLSSTVERAHVFGRNPDGTEDVLQKFSVTKPGTYIIVLQWEEGMASQGNSIGAIADLDIYIVDDLGNLIVGNNRQSTNKDATEILVFQARGPGDANIMITSANGSPAPNLAFRYIAFRSNGLEFKEYFGAPTISGHAMLPEAHAVAAVHYEKSDNPVPAYYSSYGGVLPDGFNAKVAFTAPDGVHTNVASIGKFKSGDIFSSFYGTSASVPHAAAAMALLMSAQPYWYPEGFPLEGVSVTNPLADQAIQLLSQNTTPAGNPDQAGAGFLNVEKAFKQIATQTPKLKALNRKDGILPGAEPFEVTIIGDYFPNDPTVLLDGVELEIVSKSESEIVAKVPVFTGNPGVQVSAGSITPNTETQAISDALTFLEDGKIAINIVVNDVSIEFGQTVNMTFTVEGLPEGETAESLGLPEIAFNSAAVFPYPDVNNYSITPYFDIELNESQLNAFQINFKPGILTVTKKELFIKVADQTYTYGEAIDPVLNYEYSNEGIADNEDFLLAIKNSHQLDYYPENTIALINSFKALVNDYDILALLNGGSWISSERSIQNSFKALVNGMDIVNLEIEHFMDYIEAKESQGGTTNSFKALVNSFKALVNAEDLFNGNVSFENSFKALVNSSELGGEDDPNDYTSVFAIIHEEDGSTETENRAISKLYSLDLITGLGITNGVEDRHYVFPGTFLNPMAANFTITYGHGRAAIVPANLVVETEDLLINKGEKVELNSVKSRIDGFANDENLSSVFPEGIPYYFVNAEGKEYAVGDVGVFYISIRDVKNYSISYSKQGKVYVYRACSALRKILTYLDCVEENSNDPNGLNYKAHFRYDNPNSRIIYVLPGADNYFSGNSRFSGTAPIVFLPGENTFTIDFDGERLIWNLTTLDNLNKTCVSSEANLESARCNIEDINAYNAFYSIYPNPVREVLTVEQNIEERSRIKVYNAFGALYAKAEFYSNTGKTLGIDMSGFPNGIYYVRVEGKNGYKLHNIVKE